MDKSEQINELMEALSAARAEFKAIVRDKTVTVKTRTGGAYGFTYAPLENIIDAVSGALSEHGLSVIQFPLKDSLETTLAHKSGQFVTNYTPIIQIEAGPQAYGSAVSYARRYALGALLNIAFTDDDDANIAEGNKAKRAPNPGKGAITPTDGALDSLHTDLQISARDDADFIIKQWEDGDKAGAFDAYMTLLEGDADYVTAVWGLLKPHSAMRSELKRMKEGHGRD